MGVLCTQDGCRDITEVKLANVKQVPSLLVVLGDDTGTKWSLTTKVKGVFVAAWTCSPHPHV